MFRQYLSLSTVLDFEDAIKVGKLLNWKDFTSSIICGDITTENDNLDFCIDNKIVANAEVDITNRQIIFSSRNRNGKLGLSRIDFVNIAPLADKYKYQVIWYKKN